MKQLRVKGQALALVLIIIVVSVVIAFSITNRVVQDIRQQGEERASTRAETFSEAAVENITLQLQNGQLTPPAASAQPISLFSISTQDQTGMSTLGLCNPQATDVENQCDANSIAQVGYYKMIIQFKLFDSENLETFMTPPSGAGSTTPAAQAVSKAIIHLKNNPSYVVADSKLLVKGFVRDANGLRVLSECLIDVDAAPGTTNCLPATMKITKKTDCNDVLVDSNLNDSVAGKLTKLGDYCFGVETSGSGISSYRIKPLLKATDPAIIPYVDVSVTADPTVNPQHELPIYQMAMITAGVYSGTSSNDQQVFQQSTRLVLLNKSVPEVADYVLYNGSSSPVVKSK